ncbi:MAG: helix-turn-helix domain-containing protein [Oscillospiraceae bacterium]|jgi:transcriptional regulator with XRE-family HTH domain|nr:helix-turn-helix domain-containing protein [Oscillospiraceae bacterium]
MDYRELGKRIKSARLAAGITQEVLAERVQLSSGHIAHVERATTKVSLKALVDIANALNTTPDSLLIDSNYLATPHLMDETQALFSDCNPDEFYVMLKAADAIKQSMRVRKLKRSDR